MASRWKQISSCIPFVRRLFHTKHAKVFPVGHGANVTRQHDAVFFQPSKSFQRSMSAGLYLTASHGSVSVDTSTCKSLQDSFKDSTRHFDNTGSIKGYDCFSEYSQEIFRQIVMIAFQKGTIEKNFFCFDASGILLQQDGSNVIVMIPETQIVAEQQHSIYTDRVVGPFASLVFEMSLLYLKNIRRLQPGYYYKEVLDLESSISSSGRIWWKSIGDILSHPLFWTPEQKYLAIGSATMRSLPGTSDRKNTKSTKSLTRLCSNLDFNAQLVACDKYQRVYSVAEPNFREYEVKSVNSTRDWKDDFKESFSTDYKYGKDPDPQVNQLRFIRNLLMHFVGDNICAYVDSLWKPTLRVATIELDRTSNLSVTIFRTMLALREDGKASADLQDILDIKL